MEIGEKILKYGNYLAESLLAFDAAAFIGIGFYKIQNEILGRNYGQQLTYGDLQDYLGDLGTGVACVAGGAGYLSFRIAYETFRKDKKKVYSKKIKDSNKTSLNNKSNGKVDIDEIRKRVFINYGVLSDEEKRKIESESKDLEDRISKRVYQKAECFFSSRKVLY